MINIELQNETEVVESELSEEQHINEMIGLTMKFYENDRNLRGSIEAVANLDRIETALSTTGHDATLNGLVDPSMFGDTVEASTEKIRVVRKKIRGNMWKQLRHQMTFTKKLMDKRMVGIRAANVSINKLNDKLLSGEWELALTDSKGKPNRIKGESYDAEMLNQIIPNTSATVSSLLAHFSEAIGTEMPMPMNMEYMNMLQFTVTKGPSGVLYKVLDKSKTETKRKLPVTDICPNTRTLQKLTGLSIKQLFRLNAVKTWKGLEKAMLVQSKIIDKQAALGDPASAPRCEEMRRVLMGRHDAIPKALRIIIRAYKCLTGLPLKKTGKTKKGRR